MSWLKYRGGIYREGDEDGLRRRRVVVSGGIRGLSSARFGAKQSRSTADG